MKEKRKSKAGRNPKLDPAVYRYTVRFNEEEHNRFLAMFGKSGVYARSVFLKAHFFGQPFKVLKVDKTLVDYYTIRPLTDFYVHLNIARYVFSRSKYFEHPGKRLALAGGGLSLRSRKAFQNCGAVIRSGGLCRQSAKSKVI